MVENILDGNFVVDAKQEHDFLCDVIDVVKKYDLPLFRFEQLFDQAKNAVRLSVRVNKNSLKYEDFLPKRDEQLPYTNGG